MGPRGFAWLTASFLFAASSVMTAGAASNEKKGGKKTDGYEGSKYKSYRVLVDEEHNYRFDEKGNPITPPAKKKPSKKRKKRHSAPAQQEKKEEKPAEKPKEKS